MGLASKLDAYLAGAHRLSIKSEKLARALDLINMRRETYKKHRETYCYTERELDEDVQAIDEKLADILITTLQDAGLASTLVPDEGA